MSPPKSPQCPDVVLGVLRVLYGHLHPPGVDDQEQQQIDRPMPGVLEFLLLDRTWDRPPQRVSLQDLKIRDLIDRQGPDAPTGQPFRIPIAPKHLLRSLFEPGVEASRLPVAAPMWLQVYIVENPLDRAGTDGVHDAVGDCLTSQVLGRPVGDMQSLGDGLQTGQFDDLGSLQGGKSPAVAPVESRPAGVVSARPARSGDRLARQWPGRIPSGRRPPGSVRRQRRPERYERVGLETKPGVDGEQWLAR